MPPPKSAPDNSAQVCEIAFNSNNYNNSNNFYHYFTIISPMSLKLTLQQFFHKEFIFFPIILMNLICAIILS